MPYKTVAVFGDPRQESLARLRFAIRFALQHDAHLVGLFFEPAYWDGRIPSTNVRGNAAIHSVIKEYMDEQKAVVDRAHKEFDEELGASDLSYEFRVMGDLETVDHVLFNALHSDLAILGSGTSHYPNGASAESILFNTGVPLLIVPDEWATSGRDTGERILLAWNASRESRRAITDALPLLCRAKTVSIVVVDAHNNPRHGEEPGADVARFLSRHGVQVTVEQLGSRGRPVAKVILDHGLSVDADLIVLGAYSHSRAFEAVFGGVTRHLLRSAPFPLFIVH
ncbi:nucleotide-binding universal stress UspA family protein [Rhodobium orientis]|uniref:UspA domain-containing protein n=1 Tax=Rhodobium orientis TaxID=34017 RepID=A0A327JH63_9HYPH|nr:universal stress protein [Rhodobium orientis]MBB4301358.1 nucleotide-binding universal stress UspA family protein [Rhodobium orientis]MBK5951053.1 hypothetical protein [Rhodobium orientis]RAI24634.1 hypothetical protein CH339_21840 [Rhodobium orientis]